MKPSMGRVLENHIPHPRYRSDSQANPAEVFRQVIISPYCRARIESDFWCEVIVHGDRGPGADGQTDPLGVGRWRIRLWRHCSTATPVHEAAHVLASAGHTPEWHQFYRALLLDRYDFDPEVWLEHAEKALGTKQTVPPEMDSQKYWTNWSRPSYMLDRNDWWEAEWRKSPVLSTLIIELPQSNVQGQLQLSL